MAENVDYVLTRYDADGDGALVGKVVFPATAIVAADVVEIDVGFQPRYVSWQNVTDRVGGEYWKGMADNSTLKTVAAGTRTLEVTGGNGGIRLRCERST